jgi:hypothetical protein
MGLSTHNKYFAITLGPIEGQVLYPCLLPLVLDLLARTIHDMRHLVRQYEFEVLQYVNKDSLTCAAYSSPMNNPSLILIAPII